MHVVEINSRETGSAKSVNNVVREACKEKIERDKRRGIKNRPIRAMVVGIPNVGKSTFINAFAGKACAKTGNKPGVTKGKQWIRLNKELELLDTPGILWPKFEDPEVGMRLACIGSINDEILQMQEMAAYLIKYLTDKYPGVLQERYQYEESQLESLLAEDRAFFLITSANLNKISQTTKYFLKKIRYLLVFYYYRPCVSEHKTPQRQKTVAG